MTHWIKPRDSFLIFSLRWMSNVVSRCPQNFCIFSVLNALFQILTRNETKNNDEIWSVQDEELPPIVISQKNLATQKINTIDQSIESNYSQYSESLSNWWAILPKLTDFKDKLIVVYLPCLRFRFVRWAGLMLSSRRKSSVRLVGTIAPCFQA